MNTLRRSIATLELLLVCPAVLFLGAVFLRSIQPQVYEPARTAQHIVDWYAARPHVGLWLLLIAMPLTVMVLGFLTLGREWRRNPNLRVAARQMLLLGREHASTLLITTATVGAGGILTLVAFHMLTN